MTSPGPSPARPLVELLPLVPGGWMVYQQTKTLVDPVAGTNQTVLTIDQTLSRSVIVGTYSCTVENERGESSETVVVPGDAELLYLEFI